MAKQKAANPVEETPWNEGDPSKKISLNVPFPEPLMMQLDWLISNRAIRSKSSFIRDVVAMAATEEIARAMKIKRAIVEMDQKDRLRK